MRTRKDHHTFRHGLDQHKTIASIKEPKHMETALAVRDNLSGVFLLTGHIGVVKSYVELFLERQLPVFLHLEKIGGLSTDIHGLDYLAKVIRPTGIITTKTNVVKNAKKLGLLTIQRFFLVDTEGLENIAKSLNQIEPDVVELMPARIPEMIGKVKSFTALPVITGGLLFERSQALECLHHGAAAITSSKPELWTFAPPSSDRKDIRQVV